VVTQLGGSSVVHIATGCRRIAVEVTETGRGDSSDDEDICAYFNLTSDLLGKDTGEEWLNVEVPKQKYQSTVINDDDVHSGISSNVSQLKWNTAWKAMAVSLDQS
jgi:hypothetical protein